MSSAAPTPTKSFTIALVQLGEITASKTNNLKHMRQMVLEAASGAGNGGKKPEMVVLPECFNSPYGHKYFPVYAENINFKPKSGSAYDIVNSKSESVKMLSSVAKEAGVWLLGGSIPELDESDGGKLYNTSTVYNPQGDLVALHRKIHLFDIDVPGKITFKESTTLSPGKTVTHFDTEFGRIGLAICYDIRFPELTTIAARQGCSIMIFPAAFNLTTGPLHWELLQRARAVDNQIYVSMCSAARDIGADYHAWGHSMVVDPMGHVVSEAEHTEAIIYAKIDAEKIAEARAVIPVTSQRRFDVYPDIAKNFV